MLIDIMDQIPWWYILVALLWSIYQGIRGIVEHNRNYKDKALSWSISEKLVILFIHDFAFRLICTISGFVSIYLAYWLFRENFQNLTIGAAILILFLFLIGIIGIGGQLHYIILLGKWPKIK